MRFAHYLLVFPCVFFGISAAWSAESSAELIQESGVTGGFVVCIEPADASGVAALRVHERYQVHGLLTEPARVDLLRKELRQMDVYGPVSIDSFDGKHLPYIDNMVNLVIAEELGEVTESEIMRVLAPHGKVLLGKGATRTVKTKPVPLNTDEWSHYLHDANGNAVADDEVVGPPRHMQWISGPRWSRHHDRMASMSAMVSTAGKLFYIMDEGSRISIQTPSQWQLIARDAFNGLQLWKKPISSWQNHLWPLKSGPTQLARRLVSSGNQVFVTMGLHEPVSLLDGSTGELIRTFETTKTTEEIIHHDGKLFLLVNEGPLETDSYNVGINTGDQARVAKEFKWNEQKRFVVACDVETGKELWRKETTVAPLTLSADQSRVFFHDGDRVISLDQSTGKEVWGSEPLSRKPILTINFGPKLVIQDGVLLFAGGDRNMYAYQADSGKLLWQAPHAKGGYQSPEDLLVTGGLVWSAPTTSGRDSGVFTGRDLKSGEVKVEFPPDLETYWFHHRCYIAKATTNYILPSRTGIEFVDFKKQSWDIHHWVRGGCLYGVMPCNGLVYSPPHNCACYPEAKLYGLNALAPASASRQVPAEVDAAGRLQRGPAFERQIVPSATALVGDEWPTYRHDKGRTGFSDAEVSTDLRQSWTAKLGGKLTAIVVGGGRLLVGQTDQHTVHALDPVTGKPVWSYTLGGPIDSPPTIYEGRVIFGGTDGWVYCLAAEDGALIWRFRAAPRDQRLISFDHLESVWPVHGSVLVEGDTVTCVAGRSNFLDGGLRLVRLQLKTGEKISETIMDDKNPETGNNMQEKLMTLQMPVGLPDILSSDGKSVFMRSQQFDLQGNRIAIGPHSGDFAQQGSVQKGEAAHLFAPMGFLDDTYFHRAYWVYGRSFAGGHGGYFQAGKYAPAGRMLVTDGENVIGFGRKPEYLKWTTTIEHQLFSAPKEAPEEARESADGATRGAEKGAVGKKRPGANVQTAMVQFAKDPTLDPTDKALAIEAWVRADAPNGVIVARGGPSAGFALVIDSGKPQFMVRSSRDDLTIVQGDKPIGGKWAHLCGVLASDKTLTLYVDGKPVATTPGKGLLTVDPAQAMEIGADDEGPVGAYQVPHSFTGMIDEVRLHFGDVSSNEVLQLFGNPGKPVELAQAKTVLACSFEHSQAEDLSGQGNNGVLTNVDVGEGKFGSAVAFDQKKAAKGQAARGAGSFVTPEWKSDVPLYAQAMVLTKETLFVCGPPDLIDEEATFDRLVNRDETVHDVLKRQQEAFVGEQGSVLMAVSKKDGSTQYQWKLPSLPAWDGMSAAHGRLFIATADGEIICMGEE